MKCLTHIVSLPLALPNNDTLLTETSPLLIIIQSTLQNAMQSQKHPLHGSNSSGVEPNMVSDARNGQFTGRRNAVILAPEMLDVLRQRFTNDEQQGKDCIEGTSQNYEHIFATSSHLDSDIASIALEHRNLTLNINDIHSSTCHYAHSSYKRRGTFIWDDPKLNEAENMMRILDSY